MFPQGSVLLSQNQMYFVEEKVPLGLPLFAVKDRVHLCVHKVIWIVTIK